MEQAGRRTLRVVSDVLDASSIDAAAARVLERFDRVDGGFLASGVNQ